MSTPNIHFVTDEFLRSLQTVLATHLANNPGAEDLLEQIALTLASPCPVDPVLKKLRDEFDYAQKWDRERAERGAPESEYDRNKPVESWLVYMNAYMQQALTSGCALDKRAALDAVRKVTNLGAACLAYRGCPERAS